MKTRSRPLPSNFCGTCPVCGQRYVVTRAEPDPSKSRMVFHGYRRPGTGETYGSCLGVGENPWEISSQGAVKYQRYLEVDLEHASSRLKELESGEVKQLFTHRLVNRFEIVAIEPGDPSWSTVLHCHIEETKYRVSCLESTIKRLSFRIQRWEPGSLARIGPEKQKHIRLHYDVIRGEWHAISLISERAICHARSIYECIRLASQKGWTLPPGEPLPQQPKLIDHVREAAALPDPKNRHRLTSDNKLGPIEAKIVLKIYDKMNKAKQELFDGWRANKLVEIVSRSSLYVDEINETLLAERIFSGLEWHALNTEVGR